MDRRRGEVRYCGPLKEDGFPSASSPEGFPMTLVSEPIGLDVRQGVTSQSIRGEHTELYDNELHDNVLKCFQITNPRAFLFSNLLGTFCTIYLVQLPLPHLIFAPMSSVVLQRQRPRTRLTPTSSMTRCSWKTRPVDLWTEYEIFYKTFLRIRYL